jgi:hypothetical protein
MSFDLSNLSVDSDVTEDDKDTLPAQRTFTLDSAVYDMKIDLAYLQKSQGGSLMLILHLEDDTFATAKMRERIVLTTGDAKGNRNFYVDSDGNKRLLPGMNLANVLSKLVAGKTFDQLSTDEKMVKLWSFEAREEVPTKVSVVTDLLGKELKVGILKIAENKRVQENGSWVPGNDKVEINKIDKVFDTNGKTLAERETGSEANFIEKWKERNEGRLVNKYKPVAGAPAQGSPAITPAVSDKPLFS